jgi:hypothetical protein
MTFEEWYQDHLPLMPESRADLKFLLEQVWDACMDEMADD